MNSGVASTIRNSVERNLPNAAIISVTGLVQDRAGLGLGEESSPFA